MNPHRDRSEDWIVRAKRGALTESQERELRDLLTTSAEVRLLYEAGCALDRDACVVAGDDALLERIAGQMQMRYEQHALPLRFRGVRRGIAAALLVAGVAVGAMSIPKEVMRAPRPAPTLTSTKRGSTVPTPGVSGSTFADATPATTATIVRPPLALRHESLETAVVRSGPTPARVLNAIEKAVPPTVTEAATGRFEDLAEAPTAPNAASLFAEANRARVRGDVVNALLEYEQLLLRYPGSRESGAARISLGMLCLQQGQPERALQQFRMYSAGGGPLTVEALWGEAQALRVLGRISEERAALQRILRDFPDSAYAAAAQARLAP